MIPSKNDFTEFGTIFGDRSAINTSLKMGETIVRNNASNEILEYLKMLLISSKIQENHKIIKIYVS